MRPTTRETMSTHINMKNGVYLTEYSMDPLLTPPAIAGTQPVDQDVEEKTEKNKPEDQNCPLYQK
jgi:hypothetical protein